MWQLPGFPRNNVSLYVLGDVLIDAGLPFDRRRILQQVAKMVVRGGRSVPAAPGQADREGAGQSVPSSTS